MKIKFEKKLAKIELEEKLYGRANMELVAKARMREISTWSKLKKEFHDGSFDDRGCEHPSKLNRICINSNKRKQR